MGTTNTRAWLVCGDEVVASEKEAVGVKVSANEGSIRKVVTALREMISDISIRGGDEHQPQCIAAAGMITSSLGLKEIPHVPAPAGLKEIIIASQWHQFRDISNLPFLLVPGVRTIAPNNKTMDVMRGEETLSLGLIGCALLKLPGVVLNLGSHWKAIEVDSNGRICSSVTSLSGELIDAARTQTVLASSLPQQFPEELAWSWVERGMTECRLTGLPRTLFRIRLLDLDKEGSREERLAFLVGAFVGTDLDALLDRGMLVDKQVLINGRPTIAECWRRALEQKSIHASTLSTADTERAFLKGLQKIISGARTSYPQIAQI
jgi:2-dehydro-3-deoxygalactonokinase